MPGMEYIPKLKEVEGVEGGRPLSPGSNMARTPNKIRLAKTVTHIFGKNIRGSTAIL